MKNEKIYGMAFGKLYQAFFFFPSVFSVSTKLFKKRFVIKGIPYMPIVSDFKNLAVFP